MYRLLVRELCSASWFWKIEDITDPLLHPATSGVSSEPRVLTHHGDPRAALQGQPVVSSQGCEENGRELHSLGERSQGALLPWLTPSG